MAILKRFSSSALFSCCALLACEPVDIFVFQETPSDDSSTDDDPPPPTVINLGGAGPAEEPVELGGAGAGSEQTFLVDAFDDGDTKGIEPAGWWYTVNDGTGTQVMSVVSAEDTPVVPVAQGYVLEVQAASFSDWGSAFGIDIANYDLGEGSATLTFVIAAAAPVDVVLHAIDGSGSHFTRNLSVTTSFTAMEIHLDQLFIVEENSVRRFDVSTADELQWFRFDGDANTLWLDDVALVLR